MASIRKLKSGNYQVQIRRTGMPAVTKTFSKKKDATEFVRIAEGDTELLRKLGKAPSSVPLFSKFCRSYLENYSGKDHTVKGRLEWWIDFIGDMPITKVDEFLVDDGLNKLRNSGLSGSTLNRYKSALSTVMLSFIGHPDYKRLGYQNPVRKESVSRYRENPSKERFLSVDEQTSLLKSCKSSSWQRLYLLVLMALTTGARRSELLGLKWSDLDFQGRTASLAITKNGKPRLLPLTQPVITELMKFRENSDFLIFPSTISRSTPFEFRKSWEKALKDAEIGQCRFHDLRHSAASNLVRAGRTLFEVGTLLGHSSTTMTARYSHLAIDDTRNMVDTVMGGLS